MAHGIRILDKKNGFVTVELRDVLCEIFNGNELHWSILYLYSIGDLSGGKLVPISEDEITRSEKGFFLSWEKLNAVARNFEQIYDIVLIGSRNQECLRRYNTNEEMYEACDIVIVMFDSSYWEVFTKDKNLIERWSKKFETIEWLIKK